MEILINSQTEVSHEIEIVIPYEELRPHFEEAYKKEAKNITLPGFRRGKAPRQLIRKRFGREIEFGVIEKLADRFFREALEERDIKAIGYPVLNTLDYKPDEALTVKIEYETLPIITALDYKGIKLEKLVHTVTDQDLEDLISSYQFSFRTSTEAETPTDENFVVTIDLQILDEDGNPIPDRLSEDMEVYMGDEEANPDLLSELYNMKEGEKKEVELTEEHGDHVHTVRAQIHVKSVAAIVLPEVNDEFAARATQTPDATVESFYTFLRERLNTEYANRYEQELEKDLVEEIIRRNPFAVPTGYIDMYLEKRVERFKAFFPKKMAPSEEELNDYREQQRPTAEFMARWGLLRDELYKIENIDLTDEELEEKALEESVRTGIAKDELIGFYKNTSHYSSSLLLEKLLARLFSYCEITEIDDNDISRTGLSPFDLDSVDALDEENAMPDDSTEESLPDASIPSYSPDDDDAVTRDYNEKNDDQEKPKQ